MKPEWKRDGVTWLAEMPGNVTLVASPDRVAGPLGNKPARGTYWHAQATHWDEEKRTASRFGADVYLTKCKTYRDAMRLAEKVYREAVA